MLIFDKAKGASLREAKRARKRDKNDQETLMKDAMTRSRALLLDAASKLTPVADLPPRSSSASSCSSSEDGDAQTMICPQLDGADSPPSSKRKKREKAAADGLKYDPKVHPSYVPPEKTKDKKPDKKQGKLKVPYWKPTNSKAACEPLKVRDPEFSRCIARIAEACRAKLDLPEDAVDDEFDPEEVIAVNMRQLPDESVYGRL